LVCCSGSDTTKFYISKNRHKKLCPAFSSKIVEIVSNRLGSRENRCHRLSRDIFRTKFPTRLFLKNLFGCSAKTAKKKKVLIRLPNHSNADVFVYLNSRRTTGIVDRKQFTVNSVQALLQWRRHNFVFITLHPYYIV